VTADYRALLVGAQVLIVKVDPGFKSTRVDGRLVAMPDIVRRAIGPDTPAYPWLLDARLDYRWDFNLFVMFAGPLFPLMLVFFLLSLWRVSRVERHPALAGLKRFGPPRRVLEGIENGMMLAGDKGHAGPLWVTSSWVVTLADTLRIYAIADVSGIGFEKKAKKSGNQVTERNWVRVWVRGRMLSDEVLVAEADVRPIIGLVAARLPWTIVEDTSVFERKWRENRTVCAQQADERRALHAVTVSGAPSMPAIPA
jgi:hypothetical protein